MERREGRREGRSEGESTQEWAEDTSETGGVLLCITVGRQGGRSREGVAE